MAEKPTAVTSKSLAELRTEFATTRNRITAQVNEIEARLRAPLDQVRYVNGLKGSAALALVAGAVAGFVTVRGWMRPRP